MNPLVPQVPGGREAPEIPKSSLQQTLTEEERLARWEVRAAQYRAHELALEAFGAPVRMHLMGLRTRGAMRGLLEMGVPFEDLAEHRSREARFLAAVGLDPLLSRVPLVYVLGPR
ncbi:MAG: hypothetical protein LJF04_05990 [Gemmatimonadetes bacterium]|nr:hypothetical protein [Gemmatimonadota bacterium]